MVPRMIVFDYCRSSRLDTTTGMVVVYILIIIILVLIAAALIHIFWLPIVAVIFMTAGYFAYRWYRKRKQLG